MFKNRELRIRTVKIDPATTAESEKAVASTSPEQLNEIAKDFLKTTAKIVIGVMAVSFVLTVAAEIIVKSLEQD